MQHWNMQTDAAEATIERQSILSQVREAITGTEQDFTSGNLNRAILLLAVPMVIEMAMESLFAIVDIYFVGHLGAYAAATINLTEGMLVFVYALAMGLGMGTTAVVARRIGEKDPEGAAKSAFQAVVLGVGLGLAFMAVGIPLAPQLLQVMGADPEVMAKGTWFARLSFGSTGIILLLFLMNAIFRGAGDATIAMRVLILANVINIALDPCLILGLGPFPKLGVTGPAVATAIGRTIGVVYQLYELFWRGHRVRIGKREAVIDTTAMWAIVKLSTTAILQMIIQMASWTFLIRLMARFGSTASAGYAIGIRVVIFTILPSWGLGGAAATLVGQNLGAKRPDRAEAAVWRAAHFNSAFLTLVAIVFFIFAEQIVRVFINDPAVIAVGTACLRILAIDYPLFAYGMVIVQAFNGAGDTRTPMLINFFIFWMFQLPLAWTLATQTNIGPSSVFWTIMITEFFYTLTAVIVFRRGRWKNIRV